GAESDRNVWIPLAIDIEQAGRDLLGRFVGIAAVACTAPGISYMDDDVIYQIAVRLRQALILLHHNRMFRRIVPAEVLAFLEQTLSPDELADFEPVVVAGLHKDPQLRRDLFAYLPIIENAAIAAHLRDLQRVEPE